MFMIDSIDQFHGEFPGEEMFLAGKPLTDKFTINLQNRLACVVKYLKGMIGPTLLAALKVSKFRVDQVLNLLPKASAG